MLHFDEKNTLSLDFWIGYNFGYTVKSAYIGSTYIRFLAIKDNLHGTEWKYSCCDFNLICLYQISVNNRFPPLSDQIFGPC